MRLNRDTIIAIVLLFLSGALFVSTFQLPAAMFGQLPSSLWPRIILIPLAILAFILLIQAQRTTADPSATSMGLRQWLQYYRNPIVVFFLFFLFLVTMPVLGMLIGGVLYVFVTLNVLGGWGRKQLLQHGLISAVFVIGMWTVFTQLLGVFLPEGILLRVY